MNYHTLRLVLGDQLNAQHSWYKDDNKSVLYVIAELKQEALYTKHHVQKVAAFFSAMEQFALALKKADKSVKYLTLDDTQHYHKLSDLLKHLIDTYGIETFEYQRPDEFRLLKQLRSFKAKGVKIKEVDTEHFLLPFEDIDKHFSSNKHVKMEFFYRRMRKQFSILMDDGQPRGGKWNYDHDNREAFKPKDLKTIPSPLLFSNDIKAILKRIEKHNIPTIGHSTQQLLWPTNRQQAKKLLQFFCEHCLPLFGKFQDAMTTNSEHKWSLYHSRLSFALNAKILHPMQVINTALDFYESNKQDISLSQIEGFVRQILGWREYIRGVYWANMPDYSKKNALLAKRKLPDYFWSADTKMHCMKETIQQSLDYAYAHHIQRLMITGNFCLLTGINPDEVDGWYLGIYIDAIEWVEMPNTRGMTQYADNGIVATKPYSASGAYVNRMSDYCKSCYYKVSKKETDNACPFNSLYWHFVHRHQDKLRKNGRMNMVYRNFDRMNEETKEAILKRGDWCLENIESL